MNIIYIIYTNLSIYLSIYIMYAIMLPNSRNIMRGGIIQGINLFKVIHVFQCMFFN